ncbi:MurR/RpiR family transcriptional regulator [Gottfriedia sp. NPDC056225]|uniref:MurR/RpiR family transcriptional regulator n=1 Tax=Gottfriedia sp. NPDC056225 TaxID=3345751 RepID=UPI0015598C29|nr:MurR/RpiR family transcriptional regulator [Arthrobacter citreus]
MAGTLLKIKESINTLTESEKKVANYILNSPEAVLGMLIDDLALKSKTSKAAIIRMCKRLNYKGYREFSIDLASNITNQIQNEHKYTDIKPGDTIKSIIRNVGNNHKQSIEDTQLVLEINEIENAVLALCKAKIITFYGVGASGLVAMDAFQKFLRINKKTFFYPDYHLQGMSTANISNGDVIIAISYSGETTDTVEMANIAKETGATVISITRFGENTLSKLSDINLFLSSPDTTIRSSAMGSRIGQLYILDILFSGVASMEYADIEKYLDRSKEVIAVRSLKRDLDVNNH